MIQIIVYNIASTWLLIRGRDLFRRVDRIFLYGDRSFYDRVLLGVFILLGIRGYHLILLVISTREDWIQFQQGSGTFHQQICKKFIKIEHNPNLYLECHLRLKVILMF